MHPDLGDVNNRVCHVIKMSVAGGDPDMALLINTTFPFGPDILPTNTKMLMPGSADIVQGQKTDIKLNMCRNLKQSGLLKFSCYS